MIQKTWDALPSRAKTGLIIVAGLGLGITFISSGRPSQSSSAGVPVDRVAEEAFRQGGDQGFSTGFRAGLESTFSTSFEAMKAQQEGALANAIDMDNRLLVDAILSRATQYRLSAQAYERETGKPGSDWLHERLNENLKERSDLAIQWRTISMSAGQDQKVAVNLINAQAIKLAIGQSMGGSAIDTTVPLASGLSPTQRYLAERQQVEEQIQQHLAAMRQFSTGEPIPHEGGSGYE